MIPSDKVQNIINKYNSLEKELSAGEFDAKQFAKKSKEYSDLKNIIKIAREYLNYDKNKQDLKHIHEDVEKLGRAQWMDENWPGGIPDQDWEYQ